MKAYMGWIIIYDDEIHHNLIAMSATMSTATSSMTRHQSYGITTFFAL
jgi:roadblock/LC7 domain-containing protein